ncbi:MAG: DUF1592 domain-containing protein, partial [Myxococcales bacterium]|nr:DUF1592 domain-containing protein [Myxococcales bacterium]
MKQRSKASVVALAALFLAGVAGMAAQGLGCAGPGHGGSGLDDQGGADADLDEASASTTPGVDAGIVAPAPPPQGVAIFSQSCSGSGPSVDWAPLRRISRIEYNNMVRDLLGDATHPANAFPPETNLGSPNIEGINLSANTYAAPSTTAVQDYIQAAESIAESFVGDTNRLNNVVVNGIPSCGQAKDDTCAKDFIASFANRAYRGQLDDTESSGLFSVYSMTKAKFDWTTGIQAVVTAVLSSPRFLYVFELGNGSPNGHVVPLAPYEVAARLAFYLWRSVPDATLMSAAAAGQLSTAAQVQTQAQRMLTVKDNSGHLLAEDAIDDFTTQWMQLTAIAAKDTQYTKYNGNSALPQAMYAETRLDVSQAFLAENATLTDVLTQKSSYV